METSSNDDYLLQDHIDEEMIDIGMAEEAEHLYREQGRSAFISFEEVKND